MKFLGTLFTLFLVAAFGIGVHFAFLYFVPEYNYRSFKSEMEENQRLSFRTPTVMQKRILDLGEQHSLPFDKEHPEKNITMNKQGEGTYSANIKWTVDFDYYGFYQKTFEYEVDIAAAVERDDR